MGFFDGSYFGGSYWASPYWGRATSVTDALPCDVLAVDGGKGTGPNPRGRDYPFVAPSSDISGVLADFWVCFATPETPVQLPLRLSWLYGMDKAINCGAAGPPGGAAPSVPRHQAEVQVIDAVGTVVFDSTIAYWFRASQISSRLRSYEWRTRVGDCRLVQHTAFPTPQDVRLLPDSIAPVDGRLDERCVQERPARLSRLEAEGSILSVVGNGALRGGYNVTIGTAAVRSGLRRGAALTFNVIAGSGEGRYPACDLLPRYVTAINGKPAAGNLSLDVSDCLWLRRTSSTSHAMRMGNDCGPCCSCDGYVRVQRAILAEWDRHVVLAASATDAAGTFRRSVDRWVANKACRDSSPLSVNAVSNGGRIAVGAGFCNTTPACLSDVTLQLTLTHTTPNAGWRLDAPLTTDGVGGIANAASTTAVWSPTGGTITHTWATVPPLASVSLRCGIELSADVVATTLSLAVSGSVDGVPISGQAIKSIDAGWGA